MRFETVLALLALFPLLTGPLAAGEPPQRRYIDARKPTEAGALPFSGAVLVGDTLYLSGKIGLDENRSVPESAEAEARNVLDQVRDTLAKAGMTMDDLVSVQVFCSHVDHYAAFNRVYRTYFERAFPARAFVGSGALLFGARFEVQGIAVRSVKRAQ